MEVLKEDNCEKQKRTFSKSKENYWNQGIRDMRQSKKRRINFEVEIANEKYQEQIKEKGTPIDEITTSELREKIKAMGKSTRLGGKREKKSRIYQEPLIGEDWFNITES